jgi:hypothetical protein
MGLTRAQEAIWQKARSLGSGSQAVGLSDETCAYLAARVIQDIGQNSKYSYLPTSIPDFFGKQPSHTLILPILDGKALFENLVTATPDADTYFACLAALHKARLKYEKILSTQAFPTLEQVGPRGLLQYGTLNAGCLAAFLFWRKWFFDIDNRAGQETGYLFEPIIASSIGGIPAPARKNLSREGQILVKADKLTVYAMSVLMNLRYD